MKNNRITIILVTIALLLSIPYIAMQYTSEVNWDYSDFIAMGSLLLITGLSIEFVLRKVTTTKNRILICCAILLLFLIVWAELAVGILGTPVAGS